VIQAGGKDRVLLVILCGVEASGSSKDLLGPDQIDLDDDRSDSGFFGDA